MIQRIQTVYLIITLLISTGLLIYNEFEILVVIICSGISGLLSLISIFLYKKRQHQFVLGRLNIISNFILLGFLLNQSLKLLGETFVSVKSIEVLLPSISIVLLVLANKAIKKDEDLVKSVDRLR